MNRKAQRRAARAAAKIQKTLQQFANWQSHRKLPSDFPVKSAEPEWSSKEQGLRIISVVERSGVLEHLEPKMTPRRGPKARASIKALLVCITMAACLKTKSYKRSDVVAVMYGLHPDIAQMLGLLDQHGNFKPIKFKRVAYQLIKFEALLWLGWYSGATRCDLRWFSNAMVWASVPRHIRRTVKAVIVDSTPVETWARTIHYVKQYDIDKDAFAMHREQVLENPNLAEPEPMDAMKAAAAKKRGVEVGPDGKIIRSKDLAARAGHASATRKRKAHKFVGYDLTTVIACRTISWCGRPDEYKLGPHVRPYILAIDLNPAGQNPGPSGLRAILNALKLAPGITEVIADRAYTVKREKFLRPLHKLGLNVVMDYPKRRLTNPDNGTLGTRGQDVVMHCGTPLADWTPDASVTPSAQNRRTTNTKQLEEWFNDRFRRYGWRSVGPLYKPDGSVRGRQFKCSVCAGHGAHPSTAAKSYNAPMPAVPAGSRCCGGKVSARIKDLDTWQEHPYGTTVWKKSYNRRPTVEGPYGKLKSNAGLGGEACQAFGLPANTIAATAAAVAYNLKLTFADNQTNGTNTTGNGSNGAHNGSDNTAADPELDDPIPQERDEHPDAYSAADTSAEVHPPTRAHDVDSADPGASRAPP